MKQQSIEALGGIPLSTGAEMLGDVAHGVLDQMVADFRRPAYRAGFGASVLTAAVLARLGTRMSVGIVVAVMVGVSIEQLYQMAEDVHEKLTAERVELLFHGYGCPGHTTGMPAESCLADTDAPGKV